MANNRINRTLSEARIKIERRTGRGRNRAGKLSGSRRDPVWKEMMSLVSFETTRRVAAKGQWRALI
jgi:hypothetical protein